MYCRGDWYGSGSTLELLSGCEGSKGTDSKSVCLHTKLDLKVEKIRQIDRLDSLQGPCP